MNPRIVPLVVVGVSALLVASQSGAACVLFAIDGWPALVILVATGFASAALLSRLQLGQLPLRWMLLASVTLGIGVVSTAVLVLGCVGWLHRSVWTVILAALTIAGLASMSKVRRDEVMTDPHDSANSWSWLWLLVCPFLALTVLVSVIPPGVLWAEEGYGYDVLEYHLQLPKEYYQQGFIAYTPHNVYGNFPANAEMLYLLCMILQADVYTGAASAKIFNALAGIMCVLAAYVAGREWSPKAGHVSGVITASIGWLTYLAGVAFSENTMLLYLMTATAAVIRASRAETDLLRTRWVVLAGWMAGFACGCKYTAAAMGAAPLGLLVICLPWSSKRTSAAGFGLFGISVVMAFSPWLVKNSLTTGNPVFPLANSVFQAQPPGWGMDESAHFDDCHQPAADQSSFAGRIRAIGQRILGDPKQRFGPLVFLLAIARLLMPRRDRFDLILAAMLVMQLAIWAFATHLFARFAVPMIIPLVLLAGRSVESVRSATGRLVWVILIVAGASLNAWMIGREYVAHAYADGIKLPWEGADRFFLTGQGGGHEHLAVINLGLPADSKILSIGDAKAFYFLRPVDYCVVFNRNPLVTMIRQTPDPVAHVEWLRQQHYTHVLVNASEISRLRRSRYGFADEIRPELFEAWVRAGLVPMNAFRSTSTSHAFAQLYRVPENY